MRPKAIEVGGGDCLNRFATTPLALGAIWVVGISPELVSKKTHQKRAAQGKRAKAGDIETRAIKHEEEILVYFSCRNLLTRSLRTCLTVGSEEGDNDFVPIVASLNNPRLGYFDGGPTAFPQLR